LLVTAPLPKQQKQHESLIKHNAIHDRFTADALIICNGSGSSGSGSCGIGGRHSRRRRRRRSEGEE